MIVESFIIERESEADAYLDDLLKKPEYRSLDETKIRAQKYIKDDKLKKYFINKAEEMLKPLANK